MGDEIVCLRIYVRVFTCHHMVGTTIKIGILGLVAMVGIAVSIPTGLTSLILTALAGVLIIGVLASSVLT